MTYREVIDALESATRETGRFPGEPSVPCVEVGELGWINVDREDLLDELKGQADLEEESGLRAESIGLCVFIYVL